MMALQRLAGWNTHVNQWLQIYRAQYSEIGSQYREREESRKGRREVGSFRNLKHISSDSNCG